LSCRTSTSRPKRRRGSRHCCSRCRHVRVSLGTKAPKSSFCRRYLSFALLLRCGDFYVWCSPTPFLKTSVSKLLIALPHHTTITPNKILLLSRRIDILLYADSNRNSCETLAGFPASSAISATPYNRRNLRCNEDSSSKHHHHRGASIRLEHLGEPCTNEVSDAETACNVCDYASS
jgi:hypothetical protein